MSVYITRPVSQFNSTVTNRPDMSEGHWVRIHTPVGDGRWVQWDMFCEGRQTPVKSRWSSYQPNHVCVGRLRKAKFFGNGVNQAAFSGDFTGYYDEDGDGSYVQCDYKYLYMTYSGSQSMVWTADQDYSLVCLWMLTTKTGAVDFYVSTSGSGTVITGTLDTHSDNGWGPRYFTTGGNSTVKWIPLVANVASGDTITFSGSENGTFRLRGMLALTDDYVDDPDESGWSPTVWSPHQIVDKGTLRDDWADADAYDVTARYASQGAPIVIYHSSGEYQSGAVTVSGGSNTILTDADDGWTAAMVGKIITADTSSNQYTIVSYDDDDGTITVNQDASADDGDTFTVTAPLNDQWGSQQHTAEYGNGMCQVGDDTKPPVAKWYGVTAKGNALTATEIEFGSGGGQLDEGDVASYDTIVMENIGEAHFDLDRPNGPTEPLAYYVERQEFHAGGFEWNLALTPNDLAETSPHNLRWNMQTYWYVPMFSFNHGGAGATLKAYGPGNFYADGSGASLGSELNIPPAAGTSWYGDMPAMRITIPTHDLDIIYSGAPIGHLSRQRYRISQTSTEVIKLYRDTDLVGGTIQEAVEGETIGFTMSIMFDDSGSGGGKQVVGPDPHMW